jgi:Carboxypeptidase regulatory-like domain
LTSFRLSLAALAALAFLLIPATAQEITGNIGGTVTDPTGSVVPNATVSVTNTGTGVSRNTTTTSAGAFNLNALPVGNYSLHVESPGFKRYQTTGIRLDVNDRLNFDVKLEVGSLDQHVEVSAAAVQLQTETSEISNLVGAAQTQAMPLNGRVFSQLVELVPGALST